MFEYLPLYILALTWIIFAVVQDLRTREISNWLNFSLISFALAYRLFYSLNEGNWNFFLFGLGGFVLFWVLAYGLYYARAFAGGDAKLLMGLGAILPFDSYWSYASLSFVLLLLLFTLGAIYSLIYTAFLAVSNWKKFSIEFRNQLRLMNTGIFYWALFSIIILVIAILFSKSYVFSFGLALFLISGIFLLVYTRAVEKSCFLRKVNPSLLTEGDWLVSDISVGNKTIKKTVHGLDKKDIELLRKYNRSVVIRYGIPFGPAFLLGFGAFLIILYYFPEFLRLVGF